MYTHHYRITWARVWPRCVTSREEARCHHFPFLLMGHTHTHIHESIWYNILPNSFRLLLLRYDKNKITSLTIHTSCICQIKSTLYAGTSSKSYTFFESLDADLDEMRYEWVKIESFTTQILGQVRKQSVNLIFNIGN